MYIMAKAKKMSATQARAQLAKAVNQAAFGGERIVLERHGKPIAAVVPIEDYQLLEELEEKADIEAVRKARKEKGPLVPWEKIKKDLKL
jgi:prevent-host-death family protein